MFFELKIEWKISFKRKTSVRNSVLGATISSQLPHKQNTLFSVELAFRRRRQRNRRMAIAFYVPEEYGPPPPQQQQVPVVIDVHEQHMQNAAAHHQDTNNNNVIGGNVNNQPDNGNDLLGFVNQFGREVMAVLQRNRGDQQQRNSSAARYGANSGGADNRSSSHHHQSAPHRQPLQSRRRHPAQRQDNHLSPDPPQPLPDLLSLSSLPDIVTCHAGMSFRYGSSHPSSVVQPEQSSRLDFPPAADESGDSLLLTSSPSSSSDHTGPQPLSPRSNQFPATSSMDFEVSLKVNMTMGLGNDDLAYLSSDENNVPAQAQHHHNSPEEFRRAGQILRHIADNFQTERAHHHRDSQSTFELNVVISVAVPAVALIGFGLAYLRRNGLA